MLLAPAPALALAPVLALALVAPARAEVLRHALLVGNNAPVAGLQTLRWAESDADRLAEVLVEMGGFDRQQVTVLRSPDGPALQAALEAHRRLAAQEGEDLFLFYYSGHADEAGLRLSDRALPFEELRQAVRQMPAEVKLGVLDACRSGEITRIKGLAIAPAFLNEADLSARGEAWLTAASADESAQESDRIQGSFFTHFLVSGLRGAADTGNGLVSLDEAYAYAYERTVARTGGTSGGTQHPSYDFRIQGKGDLPLTDVRRASARLRLPAEMAGVLTVLREPDEQPVAEVAKSEGQETVLALPPGTYRLQLRVGGGTQEGRVGLSDGADLRLPPLAFREVDGSLALKGEAGEGAQGSGPAQAQGAAQDEAQADRSLDLDAPGPPPVGSAEPGFRPHRWIGQAAEWSGETLMAAGARLQGGGQGERAAGEGPDLRHSPAIAVGASLLLPGAGQAYNGQWARGGAMFGGWLLVTGGSLSLAELRGEDRTTWGGMVAQGLTPGLMLAHGLRGWAAADAWQHHRQEARRPVEGLALSYGGAWALDGEGASAPGLSADWIIEPGFSLGLDRTGVRQRASGSWLFDSGARLGFGLTERGRLRPGLFVYGGLRLDTGIDGAIPVVGRTGLGGNLRAYLTPRYFLELEGRVGTRGAEPELDMGGGFGLHFGRPGPEPSAWREKKAR